MRTVVAYAAVILSVVSVTVSAQSSDEWYLNKPIRDVVFEGLETVTENELSLIVEPFIGEPFTEQSFLELQRRLYALDYFEQIIPNADRVDGGEEEMILRFEVRERPSVGEIEFSGNRRIGRNQLLDTILLTRGDMITQSRLRLDADAIEALYLERGFPDVTVDVSVDDDGDQPVVRFSISEGDQLSISSISFEGNQFVSDATLRGVMALQERTILNRGLFQAALLESDRLAIERYYSQQGYVDARVVDIAQEVIPEEDGERASIAMTIFVEEGAQYIYGGISFEGNTIFGDEELGDLVRLEPGDVLDLARLDADYQRIADRYYENGYIFNQITRREVRTEGSNEIAFVIQIVERNRAHIENIVFIGNEKTEDYVLERELPLEVGDVFSATRIREGLQNLANLQYFSAITPETPVGSAEGLMDLIINLEETTTADVSFGVAFGGNQEFPVSGTIQWADRNFLGRGQTFGVQALASPVNQRVSFNFLERWLFGRRWSGGVSLLFERDQISGVPQDVLWPVYSDGAADAVPDPFSADDYVFTGTQEFDGVTYAAGDAFPGIPTAAQIEANALQTEFAYLGGVSSSIPDAYLMAYDSYAIQLAANTGYTFSTPAGRLIPRTSVSSSINYITYDDALYRPANEATRDNLNTWRFKNTWNLGVALDARDIFFSPTSGYRIDQGLELTGGFLSGQRHYIKSESLIEGYVTLAERDFGDWPWKLVLGVQSALDLVLPNFYLSDGSERFFDPSASDLLRLDGFFNARGWPLQSNGAALWNNWIELRMPISEQVLWFDTFLEGATIRQFEGDASTWSNREELSSIALSDWQFTVGTGLRFVIPQFPIRLYLAKRFEFAEDGSIEWQPGNLFGSGEGTGGLDLVFTIGAEFF